MTGFFLKVWKIFLGVLLALELGLLVLVMIAVILTDLLIIWKPAICLLEEKRLKL